MTCPNCNQEIEDGAAFCGNCGQPLTETPSPIARAFEQQASKSDRGVNPTALAAVGAAALAGVPNYALVRPHEHADELKSFLSVIAAVLGIVSVLLVPLLAIAFGAAGMVLGTMSRHHGRKGFSTAGIVVGVISIAAGLGMWSYAVSHNGTVKRTLSARNDPPASSTQAVATSSVDTPCYATGFVDTLNVSLNAADGCDMNAYNGNTMNASTNIYKVYGNEVTSINEANFTNVARQALEKDVRTTLPGFTVDSERAGLFAGSPAYAINVSDPSHNVAVMEAAVLHKVGAGYNFFVLVHATNGASTDLSTLEAAWQWK